MTRSSCEFFYSLQSIIEPFVERGNTEKSRSFDFKTLLFSPAPSHSEKLGGVSRLQNVAFFRQRRHRSHNHKQYVFQTYIVSYDEITAQNAHILTRETREECKNNYLVLGDSPGAQLRAKFAHCNLVTRQKCSEQRMLNFRLAFFVKLSVIPMQDEKYFRVASLQFSILSKCKCTNIEHLKESPKGTHLYTRNI